MAQKLPFLKFYPGDWMKDPALRACSYAAKGLWADMLCLMHEAPNRGFLQHASGDPISASQLARMTGGGVDEVAGLLNELQAAGVYSCSKADAIFSRRMVREEQERQVAVSNGKLGGNPALKGDKGGVGRGDNPLANPQRSEVRGQIRERENAGVNEQIHPAATFEHRHDAEGILAAFPNRTGGRAARSAIRDALVRVGRGSDDGWPSGTPPPEDPAAWLLGRVAAYAVSAEAKRGGGAFVPTATKWFSEARYLDGDETWNRAPERGRTEGGAAARRAERAAGQHAEPSGVKVREL